MRDIILTCCHGNMMYNDVVTKPVGEELYRLLSNKGYDVLLHINDMPRKFGDMNRPWTRHTEWRVQLRKYLKQGTRFLLDIHGFPHYSTSELSGNDMVILESYPRLQMGIPEAYYAMVQRYNGDMIVDFQRASKPNDIVKESFEIGVPAVLVEHNESGVPERYARIHFKALNQYIKFF